MFVLIRYQLLTVVLLDRLRDLKMEWIALLIPCRVKLITMLILLALARISE